MHNKSISVLADYKRYTASTGIKGFLKAYFGTANYRVIFLFRLRKKFSKLPILSNILNFIFWHSAFNRSVETPKAADIGAGFYMIHSGVVTINSGTKIGKNCTIVNSATLGGVFRGKMKGSPTLGDNVYIGPNSCIFGKVTIGNNVAIGANSVVLTNIPDNSVVVGSPAKVVSDKGSKEYITRPV